MTSQLSLRPKESSSCLTHIANIETRMGAASSKRDVDRPPLPSLVSSTDVPNRAEQFDGRNRAEQSTPKLKAPPPPKQKTKLERVVEMDEACLFSLFM